MEKQSKSYIQRPQKTALICAFAVLSALFLVGAVILYCLYRNEREQDYYWYFLMALMLSVCGVLLLIAVIERRIKFFDGYYTEYYLFIPLRKIRYGDIKYISLSGASYYYFNGSGLLDYWEAYGVFEDDGRKIKKQRVQIMAHKDKFPVEKLTGNMTGNDVWRLGYYEKQSYMAGLFENKCLEELLTRTECKFYVMAGVYSKFKKELDSLFYKHPQLQQRMTVVM